MISSNKKVLVFIVVIVSLISCELFANTINNYANIIAQASESVVQITVANKATVNQLDTVGSGVILSAQGYIVTNYHVIQGSRRVAIELFDGRRAKAEVVAYDADLDLAILKTTLRPLIAIHLATHDSVQLGDVVFSLGNPHGMGHTVTQGIISALNRSRLTVNQHESYIQVDAGIYPGNSGGALIDAQGKLVGITTATFITKRQNDTMGYAIPVHVVENAFEQLLRHGKVYRGWVGLDVVTLSARVATRYGLPNRRGVVVVKVLDSAFAKAVKVHDIIIGVNGGVVTNTRSFLNNVAARKPYSPLRLTLVRAGKIRHESVTVMKNPLSNKPGSENSHSPTHHRGDFRPDSR